MIPPSEPRRGGLAATALLGTCLMSETAAGAALPAGLRLFSLTAGSIAPAIASASVAVALGAALGSMRGGKAGSTARRADHDPRRLVLFTTGLALALALSPLLFSALRSAYLSLWPVLGAKSAGVWALRLLLAAVLFSPPAFFLGGLVRALARLIHTGPEEDPIGPGCSFGLGAAGMALGVACGGGVLLPALGMKGAFFVALGLAGCAAAASVLVARVDGTEEAEVAASSAAMDASSEDRRPLRRGRTGRGLAACLFGFALWSAFLCWSRTLQLILGPTDRTGDTAAAVFLAGLALGSLIMAGAGVRARPPVVVLLLSVATLLIYGSMFLVPWLSTFYLRLAPSYASGALAALLSTLMSAILMLPAALVLGAGLAALPALGGSRGSLAAPAIAGEPASLGCGSTLSPALLGACVAAVATPLLVVPTLGLRRSFSLAAAVALLAAVVLTGESLVRRPAIRGTIVSGMLGVAVLIGAFPAGWDPRIVGAGLYRYATHAPERFGSSQRYLEGRRRARAPLFFHEGREACVVVVPSAQSVPGAPEADTLVLSLDGRSAANTGVDLRTQILTGEIPVLLHGATDRVLIVDFLTGVTAGSVLKHPVTSLTIIEREPAVLQAAALFLDAAGHPLDDPRLRTVIDSPRARLLVDPARYDVIVLAATDPWLSHTAALITSEGYALLRRRLLPGGLLAQRLSLAAAESSALRALMRTFAQAFDSVMVFQLTPDDLLLVGSQAPLRVNAGRLASVSSSNAAVAADLRRAVALDPKEIVIALRLGGDGLRRLMGPGPLNDDDGWLVQVASARNLAVHRNEDLSKAIDGAWAGFGSLIDNEGATHEAQAAFLYGLAKSLLGLTAEPARALEVARELAGLGEITRSRWVTGEALLQQKDFDGAVGEWNSVLDLAPGDLDALFSLGMFYLDTQDYAEADRFLSRAVRHQPEVAIVRYHHGRALFYLGRYQEAIAELRKARDLAAGREAYPLADYFVGLSAARLGQDAVAAQALQDYLKWAYEQSVLTRVEVDAHLKLAEVFDHQGKRFDALRQRQKADQLRERITAYGQAHQGEGSPIDQGQGQPAAPESPATLPDQQAPQKSDGR